MADFASIKLPVVYADGVDVALCGCAECWNNRRR